jgi:hypothetical protein
MRALREESARACLRNATLCSLGLAQVVLAAEVS